MDKRLFISKKNLINRTTFTLGDSLNGCRYLYTVRGSTDNVELMGMINNQLEYFAETLYNSAEDINTRFEMKHFVGKMEYIELQYHGDLTIDDIFEVCFTS